MGGRQGEGDGERVMEREINRERETSDTERVRSRYVCESTDSQTFRPC